MIATLATLDAAIASQDEGLMRAAVKAFHPYYSFEPRPDHRDAYDEQAGFFDSSKLVSFAVGGNGCLGAEQTIFDPVARREILVGEIDGPFHVFSRSPDGRTRVSMAGRPFVKGTDLLYRVSLSNGYDFVATMAHRVLTNLGWQQLSELSVGDSIVDGCIGVSVTTNITAIEYIRTDLFYDLHVPGDNNYLAAGVWHHNSGKTYVAAQKAARFLLEGPAPQWKDTPYWVISDTYEQVCGGAWFQKLRNILPPECIDYARITWKNRNREWPFSVPLKPHKDSPDTNWVIEFKSYEQGRERMQSTAIGGAWFTEQFPWELFNEVIRGLRENMQPGCVICEFTPIDPEKSVEVEEAFQQWEAGNAAYQHYAFYRMSTEEALKAGHCKQEWYDTFFAGISDEMQDTRKIGAFASYEGSIYQSFDGKVHLVDEIKPPQGVWHRRSIDWGASAEHPFVCLWGFKNGLGQWFIYDEYWNNSQSVTILDHIDEIKDRHRWVGNSPYFGTTYADPSRPDLINLLTLHGIATSAANNNVYQGIEAVRKSLKKLPGLDEPGLFIDRNACPVLAREMRTYRWKRSSGQGLNPAAARPEPLKRNDDAADALRYLIYSDYEYKGHVPQALDRTSENMRHGVFLQDRGRRRR